MNPGEEIVFHSVLPVLDDAANELGKHIDELVFFAVARRLASRGYDFDDVIDEARRHFDHQVEYESRPHLRVVQ